jgi:hypothetical protein
LGRGCSTDHGSTALRPSPAGYLAHCLATIPASTALATPSAGDKNDFVFELLRHFDPFGNLYVRYLQCGTTFRPQVCSVLAANRSRYILHFGVSIRANDTRLAIAGLAVWLGSMKRSAPLMRVCECQSANARLAACGRHDVGRLRPQEALTPPSAS